MHQRPSWNQTRIATSQLSHVHVEAFLAHLWCFLEDSRSCDARARRQVKADKLEFELELKLIQSHMIQKPLLWVEVGKSACVLVGICELRLSPPARYDPQCPSLLDFLSGCLVRVLWT